MLEKIILTACAILTVGVIVLTAQVIRMANHVMILEQLVEEALNEDANNRS